MAIDRRALLASGLSLPLAALLPAAALARKALPLPATGPFSATGDDGAFAGTITALAPREQSLLDFGWTFTLGHGSDPVKDLGFGYGQADFSKMGILDFAKIDFDDSHWRKLNLPHDWAVELPFVHDDSGKGDAQLRSHGYKPLGRRFPENSVGWYRRVFDMPAEDAGRRIWVEFDGAFRDVLVFVNGCFVGRNDNGYAPFRFDITDFLAYGKKNALCVRVDASFGDGWFYEGAGLYRHVWMLKTDALHLERWGSVVRPILEDGKAKLALSTTVKNAGDAARNALVRWTILDPAGKTVATAEAPAQTVDPDGHAAFSADVDLVDPALWSIETPNLYTALVTVESDGKVYDGERVSFGVRSAVFDANKGFFLNDQHLKIQGVCNHQDHAGVGAALPDQLQAFRVGVMQQMGCNAIRTSHNMPTPELVEACDRLGMMMMCETRQMSSSPEGMQQLETMIRRYRNSPSIIIWSIGNEEYLLQKPMAEQGARIAASMVRRCHELDPTRVVSAAVNDDNRQGVSDPLDIIGFNYVQWQPDGFHKDFPARPIFGSETSSAVSTRGEYKTDAARNVMSSYDGVVSWGQTPWDWWQFQMARDWEAGGFAWTGFDYRGEPTPYGWPSISSQFGIVDTCGFPKDYFYYYKAWWGKAPVLHLFPHWNWAGQEGQTIPVWVHGNLDEVELLVNGRSLGRQKMPKLGHLVWQVVYAPGSIEARGYKDGRLVLTQRRETTGAPAAIRLTPDRVRIEANGEDVVVLTVEALDTKGRPVPTANNKIAFTVTGGTLIGVGNGDPNCLESDKAPRRSLYNGLAQVIIQAGKQAGDIVIEAASDDDAHLRPARLAVAAAAAQARPAIA